MHLSSQVYSSVLLLLLLGLVLPAAIALYRIRSLALPISTVTAAATIILPLFTAVTLRGARSRTRRSHGGAGEGKIGFSWSAVTLIMLLVIYETVIAVLALTHMAPPNDLSCHLERQWSWLFSNKNADVIRRIQDRHQCCGLRSVQDRAWPFPDRSHTAAACHEVFGRERSCFGGWRQDEQTTGGLMLFVAAAAFLLKLLMLVIHEGHNPFHSSIRSAFSRFATNGEASTGNIQRRIGDSYHDDPLVDGLATDSLSHGEGDNQGVGPSPAMQPSRPQVDENEWRDV